MSTPQITQARFVLAVPDLARSSAYYTSVLGMDVEFTVPGWVFLCRDGFRVMLGECQDAIATGDLGDHAWYGYLTVHDAASLFEEYRAAGAEFTQELSDTPWGMR